VAPVNDQPGPVEHWITGAIIIAAGLFVAAGFYVYFIIK
jgi:hypothetical protein